MSLITQSDIFFLPAFLKRLIVRTLGIGERITGGLKLTKHINYATVNGMPKRIITVICIISISISAKAYPFWVWTPETNKWVNPKYSVKETPQAQLEYAQGFYQSKDYKKAIDEFNKLINNYPKAKEAPEAQYSIGLCLEDQDKLYEAFKAYQQIIEKYPFSERSAEVVTKQFGIGEKILEGEQKKSKFINAMTGGNYDVVDVFRTVIKNSPYGPNAALTQYKIALYLKEKELFQEARDEFEKVINDYPKSEWAKGAQYQIALVDAQRSSHAQYDQKVTKAAVDELKEFVNQNPDAELSDKAQNEIQRLKEKEAENKFLVANFYEKQKNYKAAKIYYSVIVDHYKNTVWATKALEKIQQVDQKNSSAKK